MLLAAMTRTDSVDDETALFATYYIERSGGRIYYNILVQSAVGRLGGDSGYPSNRAAGTPNLIKNLQSIKILWHI